MEKVLLLQFIAHLIADFFLQNEKWCLSKQTKGLRSEYLYYHVLIVLGVSWCFTFSLAFLPYAVFIAISHFLIDVLKRYTEKYIANEENKNSIISTLLNKNTFLVDQLLHVIILYLSVVSFTERNPLPEYIIAFEVKSLLFIAGYLFCMKPSNVLIRNYLSALDLGKTTTLDVKKKEDLQKAGRWIGTIERVLSFTLVLLTQYSAIGFIIAAKSILRYNDARFGETEYILIGTLMSFGIAILLGAGIQTGVFESLISCLNIVSP